MIRDPDPVAAAERAAALADWLRRGGARAFSWGRHDCCLWACDWILIRRAVDPAAPWRGVYRNARDAARVLRQGGGLLAVVDGAMAAAGLSPTAAPRDGDVGVVATADGPTLAIRAGGRWAAPAGRGICAGDFDLLAAWTV